MSKFLKKALWFLPIGVAVTDLCGSVIRVEGISMQPTLNPEGSVCSDWVIVDKFSIKLLHKYKRGDVVVLWSPENPHERIVKRLIALEQDVVYVPETYYLQNIPAGRCWVEGDNTQHSGDSRTAYGPVHVALIEGHVTHVVWPPWRIQRVESKVPNRRLIPQVGGHDNQL